MKIDLEGFEITKKMDLTSAAKLAELPSRLPKVIAQHLP